MIAMADVAGPLASCVPLTAVVLSVEDMAAAAVKEADRQLRDGVPAEAQQIVVGVQLIERMSCGPVKA